MTNYIPRYGSEVRLSSIINFPRGKSRFEGLNSNGAYYFNSATEAIAFLLLNLGLKPKSTVGLPLYVCSSVPQAIKVAKHNPKFLDIILDNSGYSIDFSKLSGIDVLIFVHYFGVSYQKIDAIRAAYPNILIIEDCSHISHKEYVPSKFSDAAVFSFNLHKPISCGVGGCLVINRHQNIAGIIENYNNLPAHGWRDDWRMACIFFLKSCAHSELFQKISRKYLENRRRVRSRNNPYQDIVPHRLASFSGSILGNQYFLSMERDMELNYLRIPKELRLQLKIDAVKQLIYFPLFLPSKQLRDKLNEKLHKIGVDSFILWENCFFNADFYSKDYSDCINTKIMLDKILYLPVKLLVDNRNFLKFQNVLGFLNKFVLDEF